MDTIDDYFRQLDYLEQLLDFHPDWFSILSARDWHVLDRYYGVVSHPVDSDLWRRSAIESTPEAESQAKAVFRAVLESVDASASMPNL